MSDPTAELDHLYNLAGKICDEDASLDEFIELASVVVADRSACRRYLSYCRIHSALRLELRADRAAQAACQHIGIPLPETKAATFNLAGEAIDLCLDHQPAGSLASWPVAYLIATAVLGIGILIGAVTYVSQPAHVAVRPSSPVEESTKSQPEFIGRITGMVHCEWTDRATETTLGANVAMGRRYSLAAGLLEITYDSGAKVILQGPVTYEVESAAGGFLSVGKVTARVDKKEERRTKNEELPASRSSFLIPHSCFAVRTPTAIVTDLGTEFGVEVDKEGGTTSHVFRGSVKVEQVGRNGTVEDPGRGLVLHENESARVEHGDREGRGAIVPIPASSDFVRELPDYAIKLFDLVDVVAGGDGFSGRRGGGIDPRDGRCFDMPQPEDTAKYIAIGATISGDGQYHRVEKRPFVDGVFIPNGEHGAVQVDSAGHTCNAFLRASNQSGGCVMTGGILPMIPPVNNMRRVPTILNGIDYSASPHGFLFLHSNKGITFDLDAVRAAHPNFKIMRFCATTGISDPAGWAVVDAWVLVDGQIRFGRREINGALGGISIKLRIADQDRFLTLVVTDGGGDISGDWALFGDPQLELVPARAGEQRNTDSQVTE